MSLPLSLNFLGRCFAITRNVCLQGNWENDYNAKQESILNTSGQLGIAMTIIEGENHEYFYEKKSLKVLNGEWKEPKAGERNTSHNGKATSDKVWGKDL